MTMVLLAAAAAGFTLQSLARVVSLSEATISPDGSQIAFVATRIDDDRNRTVDTLERFDLRSSRSVALGPTHQSIGSLAWSPDGRTLAVVQDDPQSRAQQLYLVDASGGERRLTDGSDDVDQIAWDPSGARIAFSRQDPAPAAPSGAAAYEDGFRVGDYAYLTTAPPRPAQLWYCDLQAHEHRLTSGSMSVMSSPLSWSPDGRSIVFERAPAPHGLHDRAYVARVDVGTRAISPATPHGAFEDQGLFSRDGSHIAYLYERNGDPAEEAEAWAETAAKGDDRDLGVGLDRQVDAFGWMPDDRSLLEQVADDAQEALYRQPLDGAARRLPLGDVVAASIQPQGAVARDGTIAFIGDQERHPDELYVLRPGAASPTRLTSYNDGVAALALGRVQRVTWRSRDGMQEEGVLTYPPGYVPGRKYPLVLRIHGGPYESSTLAFSTFYQLAAAHGWLVFAPNYRGSTDLGNAYEYAIYDDPMTGPGDDVLDGIGAVERTGIVDPSRIAVSGWSYGGQMTSWLEGHARFWRAAVAGAAVNDLVADYAIADDIDADRLMFRQSSPFRGGAMALWRANSPITYFDDIRTPTLIMCNVYDVRVPIVESYEMFHALEENGVPVEFYAYPTGGHLPRGPVRDMDVDRRWMDWFARYLR